MSNPVLIAKRIAKAALATTTIKNYRQENLYIEKGWRKSSTPALLGCIYPKGIRAVYNGPYNIWGSAHKLKILYIII